MYKLTLYCLENLYKFESYLTENHTLNHFRLFPVFAFRSHAQHRSATMTDFTIR